MKGCGKIAYPSASKARQAMFRTIKRSGYKSETGLRAAHFCEHCSSWHWGNSPDVSKFGRRSKVKPDKVNLRLQAIDTSDIEGDSE